MPPCRGRSGTGANADMTRPQFRCLFGASAPTARLHHVFQAILYTTLVLPVPGGAAAQSWSPDMPELSLMPPPPSHAVILPDPLDVPAAPVPEMVPVPDTPLMDLPPAPSAELRSEPVGAVRVHGAAAVADRSELSFEGGALSEDGAALLEAVADRLRARPSERLELHAYASAARGDDLTARRVSLARAVLVRNRLMRHGVTQSRVIVFAHGDKAGDGRPDRVDVFFRP